MMKFHEVSPEGSNLENSEGTCQADPETSLFVRSVVHFNSFGAGPSGREQVVFPTLARANHSCLPNCALVHGSIDSLFETRPSCLNMLKQLHILALIVYSLFFFSPSLSL